MTNNHKNNTLYPKTVAILYSYAKREFFPTEEQYLSEADAYKDAKIVANYIEKLGIKTYLLPANNSLPELLKKTKPEMAFNLVDSIKGSEFLQSAIPGLLEIMEIPYTGAGILGASLVCNKFLVKKILEQNGIPVPRNQMVSSATEPIDSRLRYPLISKLNEIHGAVEITNDAVSDNESHLQKRIKYLTKTYKQDVLIEEFIVGRELTAMVLQGVNTKIYTAEKIFEKTKNKYILATFDANWGKGPGFSYKKYPQNENLKELVREAFNVLGHADYSKFDIREDQSGRFYFIDSNANPAFGPKETDCAISNILGLYGVDFEEILDRLILNTMRAAKNLEKIEATPNGEK